MKHFINLSDVTIDEFDQLLKLGLSLKAKQKQGIPHKLLEGKTLGMIFSKASTRTRVSFEVGMYQLGGMALFLSQNDIQLGRGESIYDTAHVLSRFLDGIMIRTFNQEDVEDLARYGSIPIINGLTDTMHPCQIMADLLTVYENKGRLAGLKLAYVGDGNNIVNSLLQGCAKAGVHISVASPKGYWCLPNVVEETQNDAAVTGAKICMTEDPEKAVKDADVVVTDTWVSMGQESEKETRINTFMPYQVNDKLFGMAKEDAIFLHCLPAYRGYEVTDSVIDGPRSLIFDEAENRLHAQKAILAMLMGG
ncbi:MAG: ornithine carbamoyltransferase [Clostridia bacterium]